MADWEPYARREAALAALEAQLGEQPADAQQMLARADLLTQLGRGDAAQAAYLALLAAHPGHRAGLNHFGALVHGLGFASAARTLYAEAARQHPGDPASQVNLANSLIEFGDTAAAQAALQAALAAQADFAPAHRALARLAAERGEIAAAEVYLRQAFAGGAVIEQPYNGAEAPVEVLLLISGLPADIPLRHVLDPSVFKVTALAPAFFDEGAEPPSHDVIVNTIGDADLCAGALAAAARLTAQARRPVINPPQQVALTGRVANAQRLGALPGVVTAACVSLSRAEVVRLDAGAVAAHGLRFPLAARAPGFHTGQHFERIEAPADLAAALARLPGESVILMNLIDTKGPDGLYRKYRAMIVDGVLHPLHMALSPHWKVHYFTADMAQRPEHRAQDAAFLTHMAGVIGPAAMAALEQVRDALGLDYGGVDFALTAAGEVVVFEANATMVVYPPPPDPIWDYRRAPVQKVLDAVRAMIGGRAGAQVLAPR